MVGVALWLAVITYWLVESPTARILLRRRVWYSTGVVLSGSVAALATLLIVTAPGLIGGGKPAQVLTLSSSNTAVVKNAVANGTSIVRAPRNLDPALRVAAKDQPVSTSDGCHANFLIVEQGSCVYGDAAGSRTMVLVGDSHAQQWLPALDQEASAKGWRLITWTKAACPIAQYDIYNPQLHRDFTECSEWRQRTIQRIIQLHPDLVVMSQSDAVPGTAVANNEWAERTVRSAREFQNAGLRVTYILDTPYPGKNVPDCVASNLDSVGDCSARVERVWPYGGRHDVMAQTLTLAGITSLEPRDWFCTIRDCPAIIGNILVYRDDSHMSTAYSAWLAPMMGPLFAETATSSSN
jgi:SGNH domain (fused to AT3 domains)